jgi:hypothetical protein
VVKVLDNFYFKEMEGKELEDAVEQAYVTLPKMETMD